MKEGTKKIIFEFFSILVAVVLAMGLTEWRQEVLNHRQAEKSFDNVLEEVARNYRTLKPDSAIMANFIKEIDKWFESDEPANDSLSIGDYELNLLNKSAWEVAKLNSSMTFIQNERLQRMSLIYELHDFYVEAGSQVFDALIELSKLEKSDPKFAMELKGVRSKLSLTYNSIIGYLSAVREVVEQERSASSSDSTDQ